MTDTPPTSVILPTVRWADACEEVADQLRPADELLVVCDGEDDPVADRDDLPDGVEVVIAGEPDGCSGKANAVAAGMEAAANDRLVWTDDDFHHPPDWLETLQADYDRHGPTSEVPLFVGQDPLAWLLEPLYAVGGTLGVYVDDIAWGGSVVFERGDVDGAFLADLRRTVSDDGLLTERTDVTTVKRVRRVEIGGSLRETVERHVRFAKILRYYDPVGGSIGLAVAVLVAVGCLLFPLPALALATLSIAAVYAAFGVRRWTVLLAYPAMIVAVPLFAYALARRSFVWGGRRYRWQDKFDVVVEPA